MNTGRFRTVASAVVAVAVLYALSGIVAQADSLRELSDAFARVAEDVKPAVVSVYSEAEMEVRYGGIPWFFEDSPLFREFFGDRFRQPNGTPPRGQKQIVRGLGSGLIIDGKKGYVLTNNHVVAGADKLKVTLADNREFDAKVKGADPRTDIAVLELLDIDGRLPEAELGRSENLRVGDWVLAIGSPYGLDQTVTVGIVSATGRGAVIRDNPSLIQDFIQTDAAINRGNSGGPLVSLDGKVIGVNTAIASQSGGYEGIGFAIPIDMVNEVLDELIETGKVTRGRLGVEILSVSGLPGEVAENLGVKVDYGAYIRGVSKDSPAEAAGIQPGDVIVEFNGERIEDSAELQRKAAATAPGSKVRVVVDRGGDRKKLTVTMGEWEDEGLAFAAGERPSEVDIGVTVRELTPEVARQLDIDEATKGVVVSRVVPGSAAQRAGLTPGTVILEVNREPVTTVREFNTALGESKGARSVLLLVQQGQMTRLVSVALE